MMERQFDLDGYEFGRWANGVEVLASGLDTGTTDVRTQDAPHPSGDGLFFGRDFLTPPTWTFQLIVKGDDVMPALWRLAAAWRADQVRSRPGARSRLTYRLNGRERVVYGRPRRFAVEPDVAWQPGLKLVTCEFALADARSYGPERELLLDLVEVNPTSGLTFPSVMPWRFTATETTRAGVVVVDAAVGSPFAVHIRGPVAGSAHSFAVWSSGWRFELDTWLGPLGNIVIDTGTGVATRNSQVFGAASIRTDWRAELQPGPQEVQFRAEDPTASATATIRWRDAAPTL